MVMELLPLQIGVLTMELLPFQIGVLRMELLPLGYVVVLLYIYQFGGNEKCKILFDLDVVCYCCLVPLQ